MVNIYIGIDPSMNSTGICMLFYQDDIFVKDMYYIVKPNKLTKKEQKVKEDIVNFEYATYQKEDLSIYKDNNLFSEYWKTVNMTRIVDTIEKCINDSIEGSKNCKIYIVQEGISYGSKMRTKSIFDLAGLNFMIRSKFIEKENILLFVATPASIKKFATGSGNANKNMIVSLFQSSNLEIAKKLPKVDDIADAYYMANYAKYIKDKSS